MCNLNNFSHIQYTEIYLQEENYKYIYFFVFISADIQTSLSYILIFGMFKIKSNIQM